MPKNNMFEVFLPSFYLYKFLLIFNFTIEGKLTNGVIKVKTADILRYILHLILNLILLYLSIVTPHNESKINILNFGNQLFVIVTIIFIIISDFLFTFNCKILWNVLKLLHKFDIEVSKR